MRTAVTLLGLLFVAAVLMAPSARAEEPSALEQLTAEERAHLESQVAGWAEFSADRQEKIARSVVRIRALPEAKRRALLERIERLKRGREAGRGPRPGRLGHHLDPRRMRAHHQRGRMMQAVSTVFWSELPETTRTAIDAAFDKRERDRVPGAFLRRLLGRIAKQRALEGVPPIPVSPDMPPERAREFEALRAKAEAGDARSLQKLAGISVFHELQQAAAALEGDGPPDETAVRRLGAVVRERYPEAFAQSMAELAQAAESEESLRRYAPQGHRGPRGRQGEPGSPEQQARRLLEMLEQSGGLLRKHPELKDAVQQLKRQLRKIVGKGPASDHPGPGSMGGRRPGNAGGRRGPPGGGRGPGRGIRPPPGAPPPEASPPDSPPDTPPADDEDR